jgi:hypothetical protein
MRNLTNKIGAAALFIVAGLPACANVIFTTGLGTSGDAPVFDTRNKSGPLSTSSDVVTFAEPFSLTSDSTATDLFVPLSLPTGTAFKGGEVDFSIVTDASGLPDSDSWGNPVGVLYSGDATGISSTTPAIFDVSLSGSATLTAGTTYWLMAQVPSPNPCGACSNKADDWYENASATNSILFTQFGAAGWDNTENPPEAFTLDNNASASTPEPSSFLLFTLGGALMLVGLVAKKSALRR